MSEHHTILIILCVIYPLILFLGASCTHDPQPQTVQLAHTTNWPQIHSDGWKMRHEEKKAREGGQSTPTIKSGGM